jgi:hypothetical protein
MPAMPILFTCPCGKRLQVPDANAGKKVRCPACNQVTTAPAPAAPEEPLQVVVLEDPPAVEELVEVVPVTPVVSAAPAPRRREGVEVIALLPVGKKARSERWRLELSNEGVLLLDEEGAVAQEFDRHEAVTRIRFPSFWLSIKYLQFLDGETVEHQFYLDKEVVRRIRAYQNRALEEDPKARQTLKKRGISVLLLGAGTAGIGLVAFAFLGLTGAFAERRSRGIGWSIVGILCGLGLMIYGVGIYVKAARRDEADE